VRADQIKAAVVRERLLCVTSFADGCFVVSSASFVAPVQVKNIKHSGSTTFDDILEIARVMRPRSMAKELSGTVKEILGTAFSTGCLVDGQSPMDIIEQINDGDIEVPDK